MSRTKFVLLLGLVLFIASLPAGLAQAQTPTPTAQQPKGEGTAVISDSAALSDRIDYDMTGVDPAGEGFAYEGWLVSDNGATKLSTGVMTVIDGVIDHTFVSPTGENLIATYDTVLITREPVPDPDPNPTTAIVFSHRIPAGARDHIRHLLVKWPDNGTKGIMTNLKEQLQLAIDHGNLARNATDPALIRTHTHHVINIIEGKSGPNFSAAHFAEGSGPGDGIGVITHAQDRKHGPFAAAAAPNDRVIAENAALVDATGKNAETWATQARDQALEVLKSLNANNINLARIQLGPGVGSVISLLEAARNGFDADLDGTVEIIATEGGASQAYVASQLMATYTLSPGAPAAPPTTPPVGETAIPMLARWGLIASLTALVIGGFILVMTRRRSRTKA